VSEPVFLTVDDVLQLHEDALEADGGAAGLRDRGLLESAVHAPQASFGGQWLVGDLFDMGATYMFHIACNHAFLDGNKRTALLATLVSSA
jgi:death-on-curing protein